MSLARVWRRQLYGASSVALIVPCAMLAALVVLALGGGFSQVGVLGQIFAGPPAPSVPGGGIGGGHVGVAARGLPVIPAHRVGAGSPAVRAVQPGVGPGRRVATVPPPSVGTSRPGGALGSGRGVTQLGAGGVGAGPGGAGAAPVQSSPKRPMPSSPPPQSPPPQPTALDRAVTVVTAVTQQVPAPAGPVVTQAVQSAGAAADGLLPGTGAPPGLPVP